MYYELNCRYDSRQSFYGKAKVEERGSTMTLFSYDTPVCKIKNGTKVRLLPLWDSSQTTLRHVKEFLKQNNFKAENKKQIAHDYEEV